MTRLERLSHLAQVLGAIAVVVSLLFVGSQIRQNTVAVQRGNAQSSLALGHEWDTWLLDADFSRTYDTGLRDYASLTSAEKLQFDRYVGQGLNIWEFAYYSARAGTMDRELWEAWDRFFASQIRQESWRTLWAGIRESYGERFRAHVDSKREENQTEQRAMHQP